MLGSFHGCGIGFPDLLACGRPRSGKRTSLSVVVELAAVLHRNLRQIPPQQFKDQWRMFKRQADDKKVGSYDHYELQSQHSILSASRVAADSTVEACSWDESCPSPLPAAFLQSLGSTTLASTVQLEVKQ